MGTFQKWCVCGLPCPSSLPRTHNTELLGILARLSSTFQGCHWFGLNLFYTWCIFSLGAMVTEKGLEPGAGEEVCNPGMGWGKGVGVESLLCSEATPSPGQAENPLRGGPVKRTTKDISQTLWGDLTAKGKVSRWKKEVGSGGKISPPLLPQSPRGATLQLLSPPSIWLSWSLAPPSIPSPCLHPLPCTPDELPYLCPALGGGSQG